MGAMMPANLRSDIKRYASRRHEAVLLTTIKALYSHPSFTGVLWYRLSRLFWLRRHNPVHRFFWILTRVPYPLIRAYSGVDLPPSVDFGPGLWIGHFGPTVINQEAKAGSNLAMHHGTTIGLGSGGVPCLGDNVTIGAGAIIIGGIRVGNNVIIAAGAVVTKDVPDNCVAVGVPAQAIPREE